MEEKLTTESRISTLEANYENMRSDVNTTSTDIREIKDKLLGRPNWYVVSTMVAMAAIIGYLLEYTF